jgi:hypothetical protein
LFYPNGADEWDDAKRCVEHGEIETGSDDRAYKPNGKNRKVRTAMAALEELSKWLEEPPDDFHDWYEEESDGEEPQLSLRTFWKRHL